MKRLFIVALLLVLAACEPVEEEIPVNPYSNPVFEPVLADPSIIRGGDGYFYAYGTEDTWDFSLDSKLVPIVRSTDLVNWEYIGDAFEEKPSWLGFKGIWAPDIQYINGMYYLYYSLSVWGDANPGIGVATSPTPQGPFTDQGKVFTSDEIGVENSIDPFVFTDDDGTLWMFWGSFRGIYAIQLSEDGLSTVGDKHHIAGGAFEASYVIQKDGYFYLFLSTGSCCDGPNSTYNVRVVRSTELLGPYEDRRGHSAIGNAASLVMDKGSQYVGVGHNSIVIDDAGDYWIVYHGINKDDPYLNNGASRRPMMIDKLIWDSKGWPQVNGFMPSETETEAPYIEEETE